MKRSEMIELMTYIIHSNRRATEAISSIDLAEAVLTMQEENKMLPPERFQITKISLSDGSEMSKHDYVNTWEFEVKSEMDLPAHRNPSSDE